MTHSVNSPSWLLAVTQAYSRTGKSIEHAAPENAGMITIEECHCMPILPCLHIVYLSFCSYCQRIKWCLLRHAKALSPNKSVTNRKSNHANAVSKWMEQQTLKRHFQTHSACDMGITIHSLKFLTHVFIFKWCLFLRGQVNVQLSVGLTLKTWNLWWKTHNAHFF